MLIEPASVSGYNRLTLDGDQYALSGQRDLTRVHYDNFCRQA